MPPAARVGDTTTHGGTITGPGVATVLIGGMPAAAAGDVHVCALPATQTHVTPSPFPTGSPTVLVGGRPALRTMDMCLCGAGAAVGELTVLIN